MKKFDVICKKCGKEMCGEIVFTFKYVVGGFPVVGIECINCGSEEEIKKWKK